MGCGVVQMLSIIHALFNDFQLCANNSIIMQTSAFLSASSAPLTVKNRLNSAISHSFG